VTPENTKQKVLEDNYLSNGFLSFSWEEVLQWIFQQSNGKTPIPGNT
jgi:hypothetical protein